MFSGIERAYGFPIRSTIMFINKHQHANCIRILIFTKQYRLIVNSCETTVPFTDLLKSPKSFVGIALRFSVSEMSTGPQPKNISMSKSDNRVASAITIALSYQKCVYARKYDPTIIEWTIFQNYISPEST